MPTRRKFRRNKRKSRRRTKRGGNDINCDPQNRLTYQNFFDRNCPCPTTVAKEVTKVCKSARETKPTQAKWIENWWKNLDEGGKTEFHDWFKKVNNNEDNSQWAKEAKKGAQTAYENFKEYSGEIYKDWIELKKENGQLKYPLHMEHIYNMASGFQNLKNFFNFMKTLEAYNKGKGKYGEFKKEMKEIKNKYGDEAGNHYSNVLLKFGNKNETETKEKLKALYLDGVAVETEDKPNIIELLKIHNAKQGGKRKKRKSRKTKRVKVREK